MSMAPWNSLTFFLGAWFFFVMPLSAEVTVERLPRKAVVKIDGRLFTEYLIQSGGKPILWPILGPTDKPMTRAYPMKRIPEEKHSDHPHQRSMWFSHGDVNGIDFWAPRKSGALIRHREFVKTESGPVGLLVTRNDWIGPDGRKQCEDQRTLQFGNDVNCRWIDFAITLKSPGRPVTFGDTKEGTFGIRVAEPMAVDSRKGGRFVNSAGQTNEAAWGKPAPWVDYQGPVDGEILGIAVLNHPSSFRFPTPWHVRTYGLFAANPFGKKEFTGDKTKDGTYTLAPGKSVSFRYRVIFHRGDERQGRIAERFEKYSK
ncbi:MAG: PmoA family protein [Pirellulales bacterium]|nr:PmoA family protein [Pirellulales bacterium]